MNTQVSVLAYSMRPGRPEKSCIYTRTLTHHDALNMHSSVPFAASCTSRLNVRCLSAEVEKGIPQLQQCVGSELFSALCTSITRLRLAGAIHVC